MTRNIPFGKPIIEEAERAAVMDVLAGPILVHGPRATTFEADFAKWTGAPHAISVSSCTAGMHLVWFALGYGPGDEVIVPSQTHTATAHAVELTGARPVFVDAERATGNIDIAAIEAAITQRTRAICVVHYLGMPVDMPRVLEIARRHKLFVMEDCALSPGSRLDGVHTGLLGDCGVFSFYPVKHITTAEGGMVITRNGDLAAKLKLQKAFGVERAHHERAIPGVYDVVALGFNYRMSEIHAALGIEQMKRIDQFLKVREKNYRALEAALKPVNGVTLFQSSHGPFKSSYYCLSFMLPERLKAKRPDFINHMKAQGIGTSVYYPAPVPRMTYYKRKYNLPDASFANAAWISDCSVALPVGPHLNTDDMAYIASGVKSALKEIA